jgi:hypothetical protein
MVIICHAGMMGNVALNIVILIQIQVLETVFVLQIAKVYYLMVAHVLPQTNAKVITVLANYVQDVFLLLNYVPETISVVQTTA